MMDSPQPSGGDILRSRVHPGDRAFAYVFSSALVRPLSVCMVPVMIGSLLGMLQGLPVLHFLYIGFPLALLIASLWTLNGLQSQIVEIRLRPDSIAVRSSLDIARKTAVIRWFRILDLQHEDGRLLVTVGREIHRILLSEWPDPHALENSLSARRAPPGEFH